MKIIEGKSMRFTKEMAEDVYEEYIKVLIKGVSYITDKSKQKQHLKNFFKFNRIIFLKSRNNTLFICILNMKKDRGDTETADVIIGRLRSYEMFSRIVERILNGEDGFTTKSDIVDKLYKEANKEIAYREKVLEEKEGKKMNLYEALGILEDAGYRMRTTMTLFNKEEEVVDYGKTVEDMKDTIIKLAERIR